MIGHADADAFYVACERLRSPALRGLPVGVLGNQGACVIAKSYELKAAGVRTGMPIWDALALCPSAVFVKRDFRWYEVISRLLLAVIQQASPVVEFYSIDEVFFDATMLPQVFQAPMLEALQALQQRLLTTAGVPVTLGVSRTKTLAKLVSDAAKPFGCGVLLDQSAIASFLRDRPIEEVTGIAERSRRKLAAYGIVTCWDFVQAPRRLIGRLLTVKGEQLWLELRGEPVYPLLTERPPHKVLSRGGSLGESTDAPDRLTAWLARNVERLVEELDHHQVYTSRLGLQLSGKHDSYWDHRLLPEPTARYTDLVRTAKALLYKWGFAWPVNRMQVLADRLCRRPLQRNLFESGDRSGDRIEIVKRLVNERCGRFAVRSGETLPLWEIYADRLTSYDICDIRGKLCF